MTGAMHPIRPVSEQIKPKAINKVCKGVFLLPYVIVD